MNSSELFFVSLHTAEPILGKPQSVDEVVYPEYARQPITVSDLRVEAGVKTTFVLRLWPQLRFPLLESGPRKIEASHFAIGTRQDSDSVVVLRGTLAKPLVVRRKEAPGLDFTIDIEPS